MIQTPKIKTSIDLGYDKPIPKPQDDRLERFLASVESRLVTRRFSKQRITHTRRRGPDQAESD